MYEAPAYIWAIIIGGATGVLATTCVVLYGGAMRAGLGRRRAALLVAGAVVVLGGWMTASALIADRGWYNAGGRAPWLPLAFLGDLGLLLALRRVPLVARALAAPGMTPRLQLPHAFRVAGIGFLITMALGGLPALFALPAGLGDITTGLAAPLVYRRLARDTGRRSAVWFNVFGTADLVLALTLGALTGFQLIHVTPSSEAIGALPIALIPTAGVPLMLALHVTSLSRLARAPRAPRPAAVPVTATAE